MPPVKRPRSITNTHHQHDQPHVNEPKPKLFQCKGFGDCHMVFTRSEHLARHTRKHTGEKPYQCIVPGCTRMFSRWDNMMQHTQTHRTNQPQLPINQHSTNQQSSQPQPRKQKVMTTPPPPPSLPQTLLPQEQVYQGGLMSPISLGSPEQPQWDDMEDNKKEQQGVPKRRLSVADLCNPIHLTLDEFEALEGFARFRETPLFYESLRDLANTAFIEPKPTSLSSPSSSSSSTLLSHHHQHH